MKIQSFFNINSIFPPNDFTQLMTKIYDFQDKKKLWLKYSFIGLSFAILLAGLIVVLQNNFVHLWVEDYATHKFKSMVVHTPKILVSSSKMRIQLDKEKVLLLESGTKLEILNQTTSRLQYGSFYGKLKVPHKKKFRILCSKYEINIIGTSFHIQYDGQEMKLYVQHGHIEVKTSNTNYSLYDKMQLLTTSKEAVLYRNGSDSSIENIELLVNQNYSDFKLRRYQKLLQPQNENEINKNPIIQTTQIEVYEHRGIVKNAIISNHIIQFEFNIVNSNYGEVGIWFPSDIPKKFNIKISEEASFYCFFMTKIENHKFLSTKNFQLTTRWQTIDTNNNLVWDETKNNYNKAQKKQKYGILVMGKGDNKWYKVIIKW